MRETIKYSIRTVLYGSIFLALIAIPQLIAHGLGAPVIL